MRVLFKVRGWLGLGEYKNRYACEEPLLNHICKCVCMCLKILSSDRLPTVTVFYFLLPLPCCEHLSSILTPLCFLLFFVFVIWLFFWHFFACTCLSADVELCFCLNVSWASLVIAYLRFFIFFIFFTPFTRVVSLLLGIWHETSQVWDTILGYTSLTSHLKKNMFLLETKAWC